MDLTFKCHTVLNCFLPYLVFAVQLPFVSEEYVIDLIDCSINRI